MSYAALSDILPSEALQLFPCLNKDFESGLRNGAGVFVDNLSDTVHPGLVHHAEFMVDSFVFEIARQLLGDEFSTMIRFECEAPNARLGFRMLDMIFEDDTNVFLVGRELDGAPPVVVRSLPDIRSFSVPRRAGEYSNPLPGNVRSMVFPFTSVRSFTKTEKRSFLILISLYPRNSINVYSLLSIRPWRRDSNRHNDIVFRAFLLPSKTPSIHSRPACQHSSGPAHFL